MVDHTRPLHTSQFRDSSATDGTIITAAIWDELERIDAELGGPPGADGAPGAPGTGMPIVYYTGSVWPARPVSAVPVMYKSLQDAAASAPTDAVEGDEWERRV